MINNENIKNEFDFKIKALNISCRKCLDTKLIWKQRSDNDDNLGWFVILNCDLCSDSLFVCYCEINNLSIQGIPIFSIEYSEDPNEIYSRSIRLPILRRMYE